MKYRVIIAAFGLSAVGVSAPLLGEVSAQIVEVPTFQVGPATPGEETRSIDVAVGTDGSLVAVWLAIDAMGRRRIETRPLSPDGTALGPAVGVDTAHEQLWGIAPEIGGGYLLALSTDVLDGVDLDHLGHALGTSFRVSAPRFNAPTPVALAVLPAGSVFVWWESDDDIPAYAHLWARLYDGAGVPRGERFAIDGPTGSGSIYIAATSDGGFAAAWMRGDGTAQSRMQLFAADGTPRTAALPIAMPFMVRRVAASPRGDLMLLGLAANGTDAVDIVVRRFDDRGVEIGTTLVDTVSGAAPAAYALAFDPNGDLHTTWRLEGPLGALPPRARELDAEGVPFGRAYDVGHEPARQIATASLGDGRFVDAWSADDGRVWANVVSLCTRAVAVCGDGAVDPRCLEACDDGAANSDTAQDACRTDCTLARCGDGVVDPGRGEECEDGNANVCDGCDRACHLERGLVCGDGLSVPGCGEPCDDGNDVVGDGCSPGCVLERIPGGGSGSTDCYTEWVAENAANQPLLDAHGHFNAKQVCVDGDPRCDFDGGTVGSCTFHVRVCANNEDLPECARGTRLATWEIVRPSARQALSSPSASAVRVAFAAVPGAIVGPAVSDVCSETVAVTVPMRGSAGAYQPGKLGLATRARLYAGKPDVDKLKLTCLPTPP